MARLEEREFAIIGDVVRSSKIRRGCIFLVLGLLILGMTALGDGLHQAEATVVIPMSLKDLTRQADLVALGKCETKKSSWDEEKKKIFTCLTIAAEQCLKGTNCPARIRIRQIGGTVGGITMEVPGIPDFHKNERVIVFLRRISADYYQIIGLSQGKFSLIRRKHKCWVRRDLSNLNFLIKSGNHFYVSKHAPTEGDVELSSFIAAIRSYVRVKP